MATLPVYMLTIAYKRGDQYGFYALNKEMQTLECKITGQQLAAMSAKNHTKGFCTTKECRHQLPEWPHIRRVENCHIKGK